MVISEVVTGGSVVISGIFISEAKDFSKNNNIKLLDGDMLYQFINAAQQPIQTQQLLSPIKTNQSEVKETLSCPVCGQSMVMRVEKKGSNVGNKFWGCSQFPKCRGVVSI